MIRIVFFATFFKYRESETYYSEEISAMVENFPNIEFLIYTFDGAKNHFEKYKNRIIWLERTSLRKFSFIKDIFTIFIKYKPDVIHSVYVFPSIIFGLLGKIFRVPTIFHGRGTDVNYLPFIGIKAKILVKLAFKINNLVLTVSNAMKYSCIKLKCRKNKIMTLYDGVNYSNFNPVGKKFYDVNRPIEILHIGRFSPEKCHDIIIDACKLLFTNNIAFNLTLIGDGPLKNEIEKKIHRHNLDNLIRVIGWVDHSLIPNYMLKSDIFILPSETEGLPISVLEAMSMELPIILTRVGGMPELAYKEGCILINKKNSVELYNAIVSYRNNPNKIKVGGKINRQRIKEKFNWKSHSEILFRVYTNLKDNCL